jgi:hypothetical protein
MIVKNSFRVDLFGTDYFESVEGYYLLRHKHGAQYYFCLYLRHSFETLQDAVNTATLYPPRDPSHLSALAKVIESDCKDSWADLVSMKKQVEAAEV